MEIKFLQMFHYFSKFDFVCIYILYFVFGFPQGALHWVTSAITGTINTYYLLSYSPESLPTTKMYFSDVVIYISLIMTLAFLRFSLEQKVLITVYPIPPNPPNAAHNNYYQVLSRIISRTNVH